MADPAPLLTVRGLSKRFGDFRALDSVGFKVLANEILGLIGPNGAGKTTLLECVAGILHGDGTLAWEGHALAAVRRKETIFYVPDGIMPYGHQTVFETLDLFARMYGVAPKSRDSAIHRLDLLAARGKRVAALSKGTLKRLMVAIGILTPQPLLLLDEPFDGLDLRQTRAVVELLKEVQRLPRTLLLSIHQLVDAERICDRFLLLREGKMLGSGTLMELRAQAGGHAGSLEEVFLALT